MPMMFTRVDSFFLRVSNLNNAINWYSDILGCNTLWRNDEGGFAAINLCGLPVTLVEEKEPGFYPGQHAPFNVYTDNLEEALNHMKSKGVECGEIETLYHVKWFWFKDMDGNRLEACSYGNQPLTANPPVMPNQPMQIYQQPIAVNQPMQMYQQPMQVNQPIQMGQPMQVSQPIQMGQPMQVNQPIQVAQPVQEAQPIQADQPVQTS